MFQTVEYLNKVFSMAEWSHRQSVPCCKTSLNFLIDWTNLKYEIISVVLNLNTAYKGNIVGYERGPQQNEAIANQCKLPFAIETKVMFEWGTGDEICNLIDQGWLISFKSTLQRSLK